MHTMKNPKSMNKRKEMNNTHLTPPYHPKSRAPVTVRENSGDGGSNSGEDKNNSGDLHHKIVLPFLSSAPASEAIMRPQGSNSSDTTRVRDSFLIWSCSHGGEETSRRCVSCATAMNENDRFRRLH
ncbi:hypothetical protein LXL04_023005 [Taraxacum kok-saghyz]